MGGIRQRNFAFAIQTYKCEGCSNCIAIMLFSCHDVIIKFNYTTIFATQRDQIIQIQRIPVNDFTV